jgi:hypothetical protein
MNEEEKKDKRRLKAAASDFDQPRNRFPQPHNKTRPFARR